MEEYKSNSYKSKENQPHEKKVNKVISGNAKVKKKNELQKAAGVFMPEDINTVKSYIFEDVVVPAVKDILLEVVKSLLGIDDRESKKSRSKTSYSSYYERSHNSYQSSSRKIGYDYDDVIVDSRAEGEEVLDALNDIINSYGFASVADLYDLVGVTGNYTDNDYGWTDIRNAQVIRIKRDEYLLKMPRTVPYE